MQVEMNNTKPRFVFFILLILAGLLGLSFSFGQYSTVRAENAFIETPNPENTPTKAPVTDDLSGQIVGGTLADPGEYPWQIELNNYGSSSHLGSYELCGGSLIHPQWVVTAAHCVKEDDGSVSLPSYLSVYAGEYDRTGVHGYVYRSVILVVRHPGYNSSTHDNDIALLKLSSPLTIGEGSNSPYTRIATIPLVSASMGNLAGTNSWVTGWGATSQGGSFSLQLREVQLPIMSNTTCNDVKHYNGRIKDNMMCAGYDAGGYDSCQGDSGGPLVVKNSTTGQWNLAGVVSWGDGCAQSYRPGVYARVSQYLSWIYSYLPTFTITGNAGIGGATISYTGGSTTSDGSGNYSITVPYGWSGKVSLTKTGYAFVPASRTYTNVTANQTSQNYTIIGTSTFAVRMMWIDDYNYNAGWRMTDHPRMMADVNGDGKADIVGFGSSGVWVSLSTGSGFAARTMWVDDFNLNAGWRMADHPRMMADVNNDGRADIIGFGSSGVWVSLSTGSSFQPRTMWIDDFNLNAGWRMTDHPRMMADVNGDGKADIVGFGSSGVWVSLSTGSSFQQRTMWIDDFNLNAGWRMADHPRMMADVNNDGRADIIGFGSSGVWVSLSTGSSFASRTMWIDDFNLNAGWRMADHPRIMADVSGDANADIVGFGSSGVWVSLSKAR